MDHEQLLCRAIDFAERFHRGQPRKGTQKPFFTHPVAVGMLVLAHGHGIDAAVVGLLHDVIEDTPADRDEVEDTFGPEIARAVVDLSEVDKTLAWEERKRAYVDHLADAADLALPACAADKIHNLRSMLWDLEEAREGGSDPDAVWRRFKRPPHQISAYNRSVWAALRGRGFSGALLDSLDAAILQFAAAVGADPASSVFAR